MHIHVPFCKQSSARISTKPKPHLGTKIGTEAMMMRRGSAPIEEWKICCSNRTPRLALPSQKTCNFIRTFVL